MDTDRITPDDFANASDETLQLSLQQAQERLRSQSELARSSDGRLQGILTAASGFAAAAVTVALSSYEENLTSLTLAAGVAGVLWIACAVVALFGMSPVQIHASGWSPDWIAADIRSKKSPRRIACEVLTHLNDMITENRKVMKLAAQRTRLAMIALALAPVLGFSAALADNTWHLLPKKHEASKPSAEAAATSSSQEARSGPHPDGSLASN